VNLHAEAKHAAMWLIVSCAILLSACATSTNETDPDKISSSEYLFGDVDSKLESKRKRLAELRTQLEELNQSVIEKMAQVKSIQRDVDKAYAAVRVTSRERSEIESEIKKQRQEIARLFMEISSKKAKLNEMKEKEDHASIKRREELTEQIAQLRKDNEALQNAIERRLALRAQQLRQN
tara:strand:- start:186 stop:722 length:537 start_codon:yes stop_codon:yes gene_type:complete